MKQIMHAAPILGELKRLLRLPRTGTQNCVYKCRDNNDGTLTLNRCKRAAGVLHLPERIEDRKVAHIGEEAFYGCASLTHVTIPDSVVTIGSRAFARCHRLNQIKMGNGVSLIGPAAFYECRSLTQVVIPDTVTRIQIGAFGKCVNLKAVYFKGNAPSLESDDVFTHAYNVTVFYLPGETTGWSPWFGGRPTARWYPQTSQQAQTLHTDGR